MIFRRIRLNMSVFLVSIYFGRISSGRFTTTEGKMSYVEILGDSGLRRLWRVIISDKGQHAQINRDAKLTFILVIILFFLSFFLFILPRDSRSTQGNPYSYSYDPPQCPVVDSW